MSKVANVAQRIDCDRNRDNYLRLVKCSHQTMADGGRLGKRSIMVTILVFEDEAEDEGGGSVAKSSL